MTLPIAFIDANVLFSSVLSDGSKLAQLLVRPGLQPVASPFVIDEAARNLVDKSTTPTDANARTARLLVLLERFDLIPDPADAVWDGPTDFEPKDRPVVLAARAGGCEILLTGDGQHFGPWFGRRLLGVRVLTPAMLRAELDREASLNTLL